MKRTAEPTVIKTVSVSLLGGFALELDGTALTDDINRSLKLWSVLAYLILHRDRPVPQTEFIETFWPDDNSSNPVNALFIPRSALDGNDLLPERQHLIPVAVYIFGCLCDQFSVFHSFASSL